MEHVSENIDHLWDNFWVITIINNPCRFKKRIELFRAFVKRMKDYKVKLCIVEAIYGQRKSEIDDPRIVADIKVVKRTNTVLWQKENLINIGINNLPADWKYVAWIDSDIDFVKKDWVKETIHQLQMHHVVQLFEDIVDLGPDDQIMKTAKSFMYCYKNDIAKIWTSSSKNNGNISKKSSKKESNFSEKKDSKSNSSEKEKEKTEEKEKKETHILKEKYGGYYQYTSKKGSYWHPGYAWAATRYAIDTVGGLFELGILGAGDHHMACSLIGEYEVSVPGEMSEDYRGHLYVWQKRARHLHKNVGYVKGTIFHYFHGKKSDRKYNDRWKVLIENKYRPSYDVYKDSQSLLVFRPSKDQLRDNIMKYFGSRNEDSIDM